MKRANVLYFALALALGLPARAENPGDEVIVVYNTRVPESKGVADYYAARRHVPTNQIFGFALPTGDNISRAEYHDGLEQPLADLLEQKKLWHVGSEIVRATNGTPAHVEWRVRESKIRYAVLCYGVPFRINADPSLKEDFPANVPPELQRNEAAVDTELALLPSLQMKLRRGGPLVNPLYAATNGAWFQPTNGLLMVTRLDGPSAAIARGLVDKAIAAETDGLWGRAYFDLRDITDPGYKPGDEWIGGAAEICRRLGFETIVDHNPWTFTPEFPMSHIAYYCGWYDANVSGPFNRTNVEFMPGAFAYHLHSLSANNLRSATTEWVGPLLAKGATITMGCVGEPYLNGTPNVAVFTGRFVFLAFSFGEAAYASQNALSWQITIVGDPLYRPFGKPAQQLHDELTARHSKLLEWSHLRLANLNLARGATAAEVAALLEPIELTRQSAVLSEKMGDLYAAQGKPSSAIEMYERSLRLDPSPQQRVRVRLILAEKLSAANRDQEAAEDLGKILQENPDYPDKLGLYRKLLLSAQKLGKKEAVASYEERIKELTPAPKGSN